MKTRAAAALPLWILVALAGLAGAGTAGLIAVAGIAGFGLAVGTLLLVGAVSHYRSAVPALAALAALALSAYAMVAFLTSGASCF